MSRCDLHVHSRFSSRSEEWLFRRFDFPDSCSDPKTIYAELRERGMDYITITDHDTIDGCLELSDKSDTFISEQVTTVFPDDTCKLNLLVWNISEAEHTEIAKLRENIFDLQKYLYTSHIAHAVAHPLYSINGALRSHHLERLILLFKHFEGLNGWRDALLSDLTETLLTSLTPARVDAFADKHGLAPTHPQPWQKILVGGSDDHGGKALAQAWTETPKAESADEFLKFVAEGKCKPKGKAGTPLALSHGFYNTISCVIQERFTQQLGPGAPLAEQMFSRFMEGRDPTEFTLREKAGFVAQGVLSGKLFELAKPANMSLWKELSSYFAQPEVKAKLANEIEPVAEPERRAFLLANMVSEQLAFRLFQKFVSQLSTGNFVESLQALSAIVPILVVLSPYIYAFHSQAPSRKWLRTVFDELLGEIPEALRNTKRAWFTDTLEDVNGVATTIRKMTAAAAAAGEQLVVVTSSGELEVDEIPLKNFVPIGEFELPEYELQKLSFPPVMQMLDYIQQERFTEVIISTPGPVGLTALLAAKMLNLQTSGIYHTDFPQYVRILTEDGFLESVAWRYMQWFYGQMDTVFVNSEQYRRSWIDRGLEPDKLKILPRGLDTKLFNPNRRTNHYLEKLGEVNGDVRLLYVGRISKEKDLDVLADAYALLVKEKSPVQLYVVGHGPFEEELAELIPGARFTGRLAGEDLANAYASADLFVFPSTTDTFGNVIIEAQASGLPVIVSDKGGPRELVTHGVNGLITKARDVSEFADAIRRLVSDDAQRKRMAIAARHTVEDRSWPSAFRKFWASTMD